MSEKEIPATEDLMKEHGLLNRIFLIYEEISFRIENNMYFEMDILKSSASIIRKFIEDYHEKNEENYIFSYLIKHNTHVELVNELIKQHNVGRMITSKILKHSENSDLIKINKYIKAFLYMYRAHETREDTIIFPAFRELADKKTFNKYSHIFEKSEEEKFGEKGYEKILNDVMDLEKRLNIYNLNKYTPNIS